MITRRTAIWTGASALLVAGCGGRPPRTIAGDPKDVRILAAALQVERQQIAFYELGLRLSDEPLLRTILEHERAHAAAIGEAIRELGGTSPGPEALPGGGPRRFADWRREAIRREEQWSAGYAALLPKLVNQQLRATFGALMTIEAEHAAALDLAR